MKHLDSRGPPWTSDQPALLSVSLQVQLAPGEWAEEVYHLHLTGEGMGLTDADQRPRSIQFPCDEARIQCKYVSFKALLIKTVVITATCFPPKDLEKCRDGQGKGFKEKSKAITNMLQPERG